MYSKLNPAWHRMQQQKGDKRIQDEASVAAELIKQFGMKRSEALKEAARICAKG